MLENIDYATLAKLTATNCAVCRRELTDAESVEISLGPICSKRYYNPLHKPTLEMVHNAVGLLAVSGLDDHIVDSFCNLVGDDHTNARKACNLLVYWASCNYDNRDIVFKCSTIIRALGYVELADKLEEDRTKATIRISENKIEAYLPDNSCLEKDLKSIPDWAKPVNERGLYLKQGYKVCWVFPRTEEGHFRAVLGLHLGGEMSCGTEGVKPIPRKRWSDVMLFRTPVEMRPKKAPANLDELPSGTYIDPRPNKPGYSEVRSPWNAAYVTELKELPWKDRQWDSFGKCWVVANTHREKLKMLLEKHFGGLLY